MSYQQIEGNRFSVNYNAIWGSYADYVVYISLNYEHHWWEVEFMKRDGAERLPKIFVISLEDAFDIVNNKYNGFFFEDIKKDLNKSKNSRI
jgi:hypothetical protein